MDQHTATVPQRAVQSWLPGLLSLVLAGTLLGCGVVGELTGGEGEADRETSASLPAGAQQIKPVFDTYIRGGSYAAKSYPDAEQLMVKWAEESFTREAYFKFSFAGVKAPVRKATFRFYVSAMGDSAAKLARVYKMNSDTLDRFSWLSPLGLRCPVPKSNSRAQHLLFALGVPASPTACPWSRFEV